MKDSTYKDKDHADEENEKEDNNSPRMARSDSTHSLYRSAYVTRICAHVTNTAAVAVILNTQITQHR